MPGTLSLRGLWPPGLARAAGPGGREVALDLARALMVEARPCRDRPRGLLAGDHIVERRHAQRQSIEISHGRPRAAALKGSHAMDLRPEVDLEAGMRVRHPRSGHDGHAAEGDVRSGGLERVECRRARHESRKWRPPRRRIKNPGRVGDPAGADDVPRGRDFVGGFTQSKLSRPVPANQPAAASRHRARRGRRRPRPGRAWRARGRLPCRAGYCRPRSFRG